ncbi:hypothetical protein [Insolitispirillum peregrinum]|uniref:hypothetical protein n=1 Tax=Insolitispirillum peregrinum TaxID=80876 RepID=UPI003618CEFC
MAQSAAAVLLLINPAHTAGQDLASDIVLPADLLEPLCHAVNDDGTLYHLEDLFGMPEEFEEFEGCDEDEEMFLSADDIEDDMSAYDQVWVWRKPRLRKG